MRVNISGLHMLGVVSFSFMHNVTFGLKVQRNKVTTGSIGVVRLEGRCGSVVRCKTRYLGFFRGGVHRQETSEPRPSTGETQGIHEICELWS